MYIHICIYICMCKHVYMHMHIQYNIHTFIYNMYIYIYNIIISYIHVGDFVTTAFIQTGQNNYINCVVTVDDELEYIPLLPYYIYIDLYYITTNGCGSLTAKIHFLTLAMADVSRGRPPATHTPGDPYTRGPIPTSDQYPPATHRLRNAGQFFFLFSIFTY